MSACGAHELHAKVLQGVANHQVMVSQPLAAIIYFHPFLKNAQGISLYSAHRLMCLLDNVANRLL